MFCIIAVNNKYVKEAKKRGLTCGVSEVQATNFKQAFSSQSKLYRKQIQFALKTLGFYSSSIDGLWGRGTSSAIVDYAQANGVGGNTPNSVFRNIVTKVDVPLSFAAPKKAAPVRTVTAPKKTITDNAGLTSIISNPSVTGRQALAICGPQAELAKSQARSQAGSTGSGGRRTYDLDCSFGSCRARDVTPSGGMWGAINRALTEANAGKRAYSAVLDSCLAQLGWRD